MQVIRDLVKDLVDRRMDEVGRENGSRYRLAMSYLNVRTEAKRWTRTQEDGEQEDDRGERAGGGA